MKRYGLEQILIECPINVVDPDGDIFTICFESGVFIIKNSDGEDITSIGSGSGSNCCCAPLSLNDALVFLNGDIVMVPCGN